MGRGRREKVSKGRGQARRNVVEEEANEGERRENIKMGNEEGSGEREEKKREGRVRRNESFYKEEEGIEGTWSLRWKH